ncbi:MAG: permease [Longimicrobiales bacterium]|nr:permease [Longimicrobiales bacterium]
MMLESLADSARTALGFFWKSGWAFVLGYSISAMIQAFVPKARLTRHMGTAGVKPVSLATVFGAISSSCSFAALSAARALVLKGAHFVAAVAFMFASTNLVIELGILIFIFLGWEFVVAEVIGGVIMIAISAVLLVLTYPESWLEAAREKVEEESAAEDQDFDWKKRIRSAEGWRRVGHNFVSEWKMVWEEIVIGFTVAGFVAVLVPASVWGSIFLLELQGSIPQWLIVLENALVAPFVAAATFIGSMGNIPLATVLNANGVLFAGIMGFIYSDLIVPPLVAVNARYYGLRVALYIAAVMYVSMVSTALILHMGYATLGITPESARVVEEVTRFAIDYTFWLNLAMVFVAAWMVWLHRRFLATDMGGDGMEMGGGSRLKRGAAWTAVTVVVTGATIWLTGLGG